MANLILVFFQFQSICFGTRRSICFTQTHQASYMQCMFGYKRLAPVPLLSSFAGSQLRKSHAGDHLSGEAGSESIHRSVMTVTTIGTSTKNCDDL